MAIKRQSTTAKVTRHASRWIINFVGSYDGVLIRYKGQEWGLCIHPRNGELIATNADGEHRKVTIRSLMKCTIRKTTLDFILPNKRVDMLLECFGL